MLTRKIALASVLLATALPTMADPVTLDFEISVASGHAKLSDLTLGSGITVGPNAWLFNTLDNGSGSGCESFPNGYGKFYNEKTGPSCGAVALRQALDSEDTVPLSFQIDTKFGFNGSFSLAYATSAGFDVSSIKFLDGLGNFIEDARGLDIALILSPTTGACDTGWICDWTTVTFENKDNLLIKSVLVSGTQGQVFYDNFSFGNVLTSDEPPVNVPEPGGIALSMAALGALAWSRKRRPA